jgi:hypothetical protein
MPALSGFMREVMPCYHFATVSLGLCVEGVAKFRFSPYNGFKTNRPRFICPTKV